MKDMALEHWNVDPEELVESNYLDSEDPVIYPPEELPMYVFRDMVDANN
jgi:hypothetical protein